MDKKSMVVIALSVVVMLFIIIGATAVEPEMSELPVREEAGMGPEMDAEELENEPMQQMKIDVQVACESALMYTTFPDGASADAFIAECVEGKHPDVIERYINDMGMDGALI